MLTPIQVRSIKSKISRILRNHAGMSPARIKKSLPIKDLQGKLYEAHVLSCIIRDLATQEKCRIQFKTVRGSTLQLKQKGSPINRNYPYFEIYKGNILLGELFTDTEFASISSSYIGNSPLANTDYHELDIVMFLPGQFGRPEFDKVMLAVECKATKIEKSTFRELLGFRRELAYFDQRKQPTYFSYWPTANIRANPMSVHMCYSTDPAITNYTENGKIFGIIMVHETI